jgi:TonB family protein
MFRAEPTPAPAPRDVAPVVRVDPAPKPAAETALEQPDAAPSPSPVNEVIPDVPRSARQTIRGTIRVSIRVIVGQDGTVLLATADEPGPSRYFARLAVEASRKWTFAPQGAAGQRMTMLRFYFRRGGTTAQAEPLQACKSC